MLTNPNTPNWSERQRRFLDAYQQRPTIATAARLAGVHRATVHRWLVNAAFADAMQAAYELFFQENRAKIQAENTARQKWLDEREWARRPMRC